MLTNNKFTLCLIANEAKHTETCMLLILGVLGLYKLV